jgi:hypothetical protein
VWIVQTPLPSVGVLIELAMQVGSREPYRAATAAPGWLKLLPCDGITTATARPCMGCGTQLFDPFAVATYAA